ncbi:MAG: hypothetical protein LBD69_03450 [Puniceicoccales bacterium]|jgi:hypothetical protein|nr:hypothetical protein [Puniceicoccales bacterium]
MKLKVLTTLSAIALSIQSKCVWCDITSDVQQANDSISQGAAWQESAQLFIDAFNHFRGGLEDAYRNCGGGGVAGLDGQRTEAVPRAAWGPRGNTRLGSPVVMGCWLTDKFCCRKPGSISCWATGHEPWLGLPTEMLNTYLSCICCGDELPHMPYYYQAWSYMIHSQEHVERYLESCCTCDEAALEACCCSGWGWFRTWADVFSCGLTRCMFNEKMFTFPEYVDRCVGRHIKSHIMATLHVASLREAGEYWQINFCQPVSELLVHICQMREVSLNDVLRLLDLYRCYVESDFGNTIQFDFSQTNYTNVRHQVHGFIAEIFGRIGHNSPIYKFFESSVANYDRNVYTFVDRETLPTVEIRPIGYYQIELPMLTGRDAIFGRINLTGSNSNGNPLLNLVAEKAQTISNNQRPVYNVTSERIGNGTLYTTTFSPSTIPYHTCRNPMYPQTNHIEFNF